LEVEALRLLKNDKGALDAMLYNMKKLNKRRSFPPLKSPYIMKRKG